jgi:radical SAM-linked protein
VSVQRVRVWFRKGERVRYISHLDVLRYWERAIRRAGLPLSYSQGFTPHPRLAFAGPLPLGFVADRELVDVSLDERVSLDDFRERLAAQTTEDLAVVDVEEVPMAGPAPQSTVTWADYAIEVPQVTPAEARERVEWLLATETLPWTEERKEKARTIDLRAGTASLSFEPAACGVMLCARLSASQDLTARPEQLVAALFPGREPGLIRRLRLHLHEPSAAHDAWRRRGRFQG